MNYLRKISAILNKSEKTKLSVVLLFSIIAAFIEMVGITLILPIITVLLNAELPNNSFILSYYKYFSFINFENNALLYSSLFLITIYLFKNLYLFIFNFFNFKIISDIGERISKELLNNYLNHDLNFHLKKNSSVLVNNCTRVVDIFRDTLIHTFIMLSEFFVLIALSILLLLFEPKGFLLSLVFLLSLTLIMFFSSKKIFVKWGEEYQSLEKERYLHLTQAFGAIREIKVFDKMLFFLNRYLVPNKRRFKITYLQQSFANIPRYVIESLFILSAVLFLVFLKINDKTNHEIIITLSLFGFAAIRLMPSFSRIFSSHQRFKFGLKAVNTIYEETKNSGHINKGNQNKFFLKKENENDYLIKLQNIKFKYESSKKHILNNINLSFKKKEFVGIVGKTGSGKSTLINLILGLLKPSEGEIIKNFSTISFVPQSIYLIDDTILKNICLGVKEENINFHFVKKCIKDVQLEDYIDSLPNGINTFVGEKGMRISGGELQRLAIARALYLKPDIVVFDEATNALDENTEKKIVEILIELSKKITVIFVTHNPSNLKHCTNVIKLDNDQITNSLQNENEYEVLKKQ